MGYLTKNYLEISEKEYEKKCEEIYEIKRKNYLKSAEEHPDKKDYYLQCAENVRYEGITELLPYEYQMYQSYFPNNFINDYSIINSNDAKDIYYNFMKKLNDPNVIETNMTYGFLYEEKNWPILMGIIDRIGEAHHSHQRYVFTEFMKGKGDFVPDVLLIGHDSDGFKLFFVEFEAVYKNITIDNGKHFGEAIRKGINQINDWKKWIPNNYNQISSELDKVTKPTGKPKELNVYSANHIFYAVVAGRRTDYSTDEIREEILRSKRDDSISIMSYDSFADAFLEQRVCVSKNEFNEYICLSGKQPLLKK